MTTESLIAGYVALGLTGFALLVVYAERRRRQFTPPPGADHIFKCDKCGLVYTDDGDVDRSRCPQCRTMNEEIKF
jgi:rubrerythrin